MAFTARLKPELEAEAKRYAESLGISLAAVLSLALRDFLDRRPPPSGPLSPSIETASGDTSLSEATSAPPSSSALPARPSDGPKRGPKPKPKPKVLHRSGAAAFERVSPHVLVKKAV